MYIYFNLIFILHYKYTYIIKIKYRILYKLYLITVNINKYLYKVILKVF